MPSATYQRELGRLDLLLGLRAEQAVVTSDLVSASMGFTDRYPGLFPTIHLGYKTGSESVVRAELQPSDSSPER
jgi:hypothetical protein